MEALERSSTRTVACWVAGCEAKYPPTSPPYHCQSYSVSAAACTPTKPPPAATYASNAPCWPASSTSPVVLRKTTAWYWARLAVVKVAASSVAVTVKPFAAPSCWMAAMPFGMEECRKPAVLEKTRTLPSGAASAGVEATVTAPAARVSPVTTAAASVLMARLRMQGSL